MPYYGDGHPCWDCGKKKVTKDSWESLWQETPYNKLSYSSTQTSLKKKVVISGVTWYFNSSDVNATTSDYIRTQYRSRQLTTIYDFYSWTSWTGWSDTSVSSSGTRQVETRTLYQYQVPQN